MSNLKKLLALVLAVAMVLSVSAFAGYDYADADKIDEACIESVSLMYGLDIMKGDGKNFNPTATITRAEMAKMIYVVLNYGKDDLAVNYKGAKMFSDVPAGEWYEGYVNYCATLDLVQGWDGKFDPNGTLTTAAAAKMLLTAIGYDAQARGYVGADWDKQVLSDAAILGLLDGYNYPTNTAAPRQWVAVMFKNALLNALTYDTITPVIFNGLLTGNTLPTSNYKTMGEKYFDLVEFEGVITANEYADLYGDSALAEGKTEIDGVKYNLSTDLTEIGESRRGYAVGKDVMYIEDAGNDVFETGEGTKINKTNTGFDLSGAEWYVNFDGGVEAYESDVRIKYVIENLKVEYTVGTNTATVKYDYSTDEKADDAAKAYFKTLGVDASEVVEAPANTYTVAVITNTIAPGKAIYAEDVACMKLIFDEADKNDTAFELGEVYVKTQSVDDISDEISWKKFKAEYLTEADEYASYTYSDNGEWLKVIDNDEDGKADYVFLTKFAMSKITDISKKGIYTLSALTDDGDNAACGFATSIDEDDMVTTSELAEGDIVLYTVIDGVYYVELAEVETNTVDKRGINDKDGTVTCGDTVYTKSAIDHADVMECDITDIDTQVSYDFYLDAFGYARLCEPSAWTKGFVLLVDAYHETDKRDTTFKAEIFNVETEDFEDVIVVDGKAGTTKDADNFIVVGGDKVDEGSWDRLKKANTVYGLKSAFETNIAGFSASEDGYTLIKIEDGSISNNAPYDDIDVVELTDLGKVTAKTLTAGTTDVLATTETVYYFVLKDSSGIEEILTWTGYANAPAAAVLADDAVAYAVTTDSEKGAYDVAEIVVFESKETDPTDVYFVYDYTTYDAITVGYDDEAEAYAADLYVDMYNRAEAAELAGKVDTLVDFFEISADGYYAEIDTAAKGEYAAEGIFAATALTDEDVDVRDYVKVDREGAKVDYFKETNVPVYIIKGDVGDWDIAESKYGVEIGDKLIMVYNADDELEYVINATQSDYLDSDAYVTTLWNKIAKDAEPAAPTYTVTVLNYVDGMDFDLAGCTKNADGTYTVYAGTYDLNVKTILGYVATDYYVTNDKEIVTESTPAGRYNIVVDSDTIVEIIADDLKLQTLTVSDGTHTNIVYTNLHPLTVEYGKTAVIEAEAKAGHTITKVTVDKAGYTVVDNKDGTYSIANVKDDLQVGFTAEPNDYTLTVKYFNAAGQLENTWNTTEKAGTEYVVALDGIAKINGKFYDAAAGYPVAIVDKDVVVEVHYVAEPVAAELEVVWGVYPGRFTNDINVTAGEKVVTVYSGSKKLGTITLAGAATAGDLTVNVVINGKESSSWTKDFTFTYDDLPTHAEMDGETIEFAEFISHDAGTTQPITAATWNAIWGK